MGGKPDYTRGPDRAIRAARRTIAVITIQQMYLLTSFCESRDNEVVFLSGNTRPLTCVPL